MIECAICGKSFSKNNYLAAHLKETHWFDLLLFPPEPIFPNLSKIISNSSVPHIHKNMFLNLPKTPPKIKITAYDKKRLSKINIIKPDFKFYDDLIRYYVLKDYSSNYHKETTISINELNDLTKILCYLKNDHKNNKLLANEQEDNKLNDDEQDNNKLLANECDDNKLNDDECDDNKLNDDECDDNKLLANECECHKLNDDECECHKLNDDECDDNKLNDDECECHRLNDDECDDNKLNDDEQDVKLEAYAIVDKPQWHTCCTLVVLAYISNNYKELENINPYYITEYAELLRNSVSELRIGGSSFELDFARYYLYHISKHPSFKNTLGKLVPQSKYIKIRDSVSLRLTESYYRLYCMKDFNDGKCHNCKKRTNFLGLSKGYSKNCSNRCRNYTGAYREKMKYKESHQYKYRCIWCNESFKLQKDLIDHVKAFHLEEVDKLRPENLKCRICGNKTEINQYKVDNGKLDVLFYNTCELHRSYEILIQDMKIFSPLKNGI